MRSWLIAASFSAFGIGYIFINVVTLFIRKSETLLIFSIFALLPAIVPSFFCIFETPRWLYKEGNVDRLGKALIAVSRSNKTGFEYREFMEQVIGDPDFREEDLENCKIRIKILRKDQKNYGKFMQVLINFSQLFTSFR